MLERSFRTIKIMTRLKKLELSLHADKFVENTETVEEFINGKNEDEQVNVHVNNDYVDTISDNSGSLSDENIPNEVRCYDIDITSALPNCFRVALSLVHSDKYLDYLAQRCNDSKIQGTTFVKLKADAVYLESDDEIEFTRKSQKNDKDYQSTIKVTNGNSSSGDGNRNVKDIQSSLYVTNNVGSTELHDTRNHKRAGFTSHVTKSILQHDFGPVKAGYHPEPLERVWLWDTHRNRRVSGNAAPFFKNLRFKR
jgi:hypothetical protein